MLLDYIAIGVIVASIIAIAAIVMRKFPVLASISVQEIPRHKQERVKSILIEGRLSRRLKSLVRPASEAFDVMRNALLAFLHKVWNSVKELERRHTLPEHKLSGKERVERDEHIKELLYEAEQLGKGEGYGEAEKKYIEVISLDPDNVGAFTGLGKVYISMKEYEQAKESLSYALKLRMHVRESTHQASKQQDGSEQASALLDRQVADHYVDLGEVCLLMDQKDQAQKCLEDAVRLEPNNPRNLDALYRFAVSVKDKALAYESLKRLRSADPDNQKLAELEQQIDNM